LLGALFFFIYLIITMGNLFERIANMFGKKEYRIVMVGLDG
jgi:hypothetical protein